MPCVDSGTMFSVEIIEGKGRPKQIPKPAGDDLGTTTSLIIRLTKLLHGTGKVVVLDSGFCILHGIIELMKRVARASALINKRRH